MDAEKVLDSISELIQEKFPLNRRYRWGKISGRISGYDFRLGNWGYVTLMYLNDECLIEYIDIHFMDERLERID